MGDENLPRNNNDAAAAPDAAGTKLDDSSRARSPLGEWKSSAADASEKEAEVNTVHILATCRKEELLPATLMVFDTIRIGFPNARIVVRRNPMNFAAAAVHEIRKAARRVDAELQETYSYIVHHAWIEGLVRRVTVPFWICDTDVVFHEKVEDWEFEEPLAGRLVPSFFDSFTNRFTYRRLHTALMFFDPKTIFEKVKAVEDLTPEHPFKTPLRLFEPFYFSHRPDPTPNMAIQFKLQHCFYDTCALLFHAIGGQAFTDEQNAAFDHLNCGTYSDLVEKSIPGISEKHRAVFARPSLLNGAVKHQDNYFNERSVLQTTG